MLTKLFIIIQIALVSIIASANLIDTSGTNAQLDINSLINGNILAEVEINSENLSTHSLRVRSFCFLNSRPTKTEAESLISPNNLQALFPKTKFSNIGPNYYSQTVVAANKEILEYRAAYELVDSRISNKSIMVLKEQIQSVFTLNQHIEDIHYLNASNKILISEGLTQISFYPYGPGIIIEIVIENQITNLGWSTAEVKVGPFVMSSPEKTYHQSSLQKSQNLIDRIKAIIVGTGG